MNRKPKYTFERNGNCWIIREWEYSPNGAIGTKIDEKYSYEEARDEVYRLNGWPGRDRACPVSIPSPD
jgi:hypothetical protein